MPVEDKPVHPITVDPGRWGCYNRPDFKGSYLAKQSVKVDEDMAGNYQMVEVTFSNSMECVTGKHGGEDKCLDCFRRVTTNSCETNKEQP